MGQIGRLGAAVALGALAVTAGVAPPTGAATAPRANPVSLSFTSARDGWALGEDGCGLKAWCLTLARTTDCARTWSAVTAPSGVGRITTPSYRFGGPGQFSVTFANRVDGWIYGWITLPTAVASVPRLWSTHDGGRHWSSVDLAAIGVQTPVLALAASAGRAYLIGGRFSGRYGIWEAAVGTDR
jgi:photosystem II stability/assembly factor-like uncharacterized protein